MPSFHAANRRLYRCTVLLGLLAAVFGRGADSGAQERVPRPPGHAASDPGDPFADDGAADLTLTATADTLDRLHAPLLRRDLGIQPAQSCAATSCHAGPRPGVTQPSIKRGAAFQLWRDNDPHARSWRTICGEESVAMMRRLKILDGYTIVDREGFDNCLSCHNSTKRFDEPRSTVQLREGVGCAGCHGPSERWVNTHYQYDWSPQSAHGDGFVNAGDLYSRARMCASCHVGDKDRDMNHDLIAAGHPTLRYELATYHAWQPKHWRDPESRDRTSYEAKLWLAGQIAATDASLALLETRANNAHTVSRWPEFAAYNCASCHHNLGLDNDRGPVGSDRRATAIYSQWHDVGLKWLIDHRKRSGEATDEDRALERALAAVKQRMETRPRPDAAAVAAAAAEARRRLATWFDAESGSRERSGFRSDRLGTLVATAASDPQTFETWESSVQFYLAAVAARESWPGGWNGPLRDVADQIQSGLRYPEMIDISRYAKRTTSRAPNATRNELALLGMQLAEGLGPVRRWTPPQQSVDDADARIESMIEEINARWESRRREREQTREAERPGDEPEATPRRRKSIDELLEERERAGDTEAGDESEAN